MAVEAVSLIVRRYIMKKLFLTGLILSLLNVMGCTSTPTYTPASMEQITIENAEGFYANDDSSRERMEITVETVYRLRLLDKKISYRNNRKACVTFELPKQITMDLAVIEMALEAYNDDNSYSRAVWFEVDGVGGYIGVSRTSQTQVSGDVILGGKEHKSWKFDLSECSVTPENEGRKTVNFSEIIEEPGPHTICTWVSTYEEYGPDSWVSVDFIIK
jgi:hypothetical protein